MVYKTERHREIVELWLNGMPMTEIAALQGVKSVRGIVMQYCDRDAVINKDGRGYWHQLARRLHPDAPLSDRDQYRLWPGREETDTEDAESAAARRVLDCVDALNDAIDHIGNRRSGASRLHQYPHRVVLNVAGGRLYAAVIPEDDQAGDPAGDHADRGRGGAQ